MSVTLLLVSVGIRYNYYSRVQYMRVELCSTWVLSYEKAVMEKSICKVKRARMVYAGGIQYSDSMRSVYKVGLPSVVTRRASGILSFM